MWAVGIILFQMLTGRHPFYQYGDTEETYIHRISKGRIDQIIKDDLDQFEVSELAKSLIIRLLGRSVQERYRVAQVIQHPWITRKLDDPVPLTQGE